MVDKKELYLLKFNPRDLLPLPQAKLQISKKMSSKKTNGRFKDRDIISINDFSKNEILYILKIASKFEKKANPNLLRGHIAAMLFFEPSTRTHQSFSSAAQRLGAGVIGFDNTEKTSMKKGETFTDTLKILANLSDVIIIRHPQEGSAKIAADTVYIPVINAGDGANQHPTQTLLDLYTMKKKADRLDGITVVFMGDLKYGRTVHGLSLALSHFKVKQIFISHPSLKMPQEFLKVLDERKVKYNQLDRLPKNLKTDFLYQTRVQKERFKNLNEYEKIKNQFILTTSFNKFLDSGVKLMHPLPRVNEIDPILDNHKNAIYFEQAKNGLYIRQALLALILGKI